MSHTFIVRKRTSREGVTVHGVQDGLEAVCNAYPDLNFEAVDVEGSTTYVVDIDNDVMYLASKVEPK